MPDLHVLVIFPRCACIGAMDIPFECIGEPSGSSAPLTNYYLLSALRLLGDRLVAYYTTIFYLKL